MEFVIPFIIICVIALIIYVAINQGDTNSKIGNLKNKIKDLEADNFDKLRLINDLHRDNYNKDDKIKNLEKIISKKKNTDTDKEEDTDHKYVSKSDLKRFKQKEIDTLLLKPDLENADKSNRFYNKKVVITGDFYNYSRQEMAVFLHKSGADINTSISKFTNIVIVGENYGPAKMAKIKSLINQGFQIKIMPEEEFTEIYENKSELINGKSKMESDNPLKDKIIAFAGVFDKWSREDLKNISQQLGAKTTSGISSNTDFVLVGDNVSTDRMQRIEKYLLEGKLNIIYSDYFDELISKYLTH
jgi:BRCT domain type II-containing protein